MLKKYKALIINRLTGINFIFQVINMHALPLSFFLTLPSLQIYHISPINNMRIAINHRKMLLYQQMQ